MRLSWSVLRLALAAWMAGSFLLEQATGEQSVDDVARSLGVSDVHDWDIRSLYRVRFQHVTKRPPPGLRAAERQSRLATRWAALRERIADFFPSRHTNPRTVVTFDKIATDFVNVGIVKLAKALDPPKPLPKSRLGRKGKVVAVVEPKQEVMVQEEAEKKEVTTTPAPKDARPKRRVTLLVDLPDFDLQDFDGLIEQQADRIIQASSTTTRTPLSTEPATKSSGRASTPPPQYPLLPETPQRLVADSPCASSADAIAHGGGDVRGFQGEDERGDGTAGDLTRRKRSWSWSSSSKVTQRPIGWNVNAKPIQQAQYPRQQYYPQQQQQFVLPQQPKYRPAVQSSFSLSFGRPTKSITRQLAKAAVAVGVAGAVSAYVKPVRPSTKSPAQRAEERERRRQQRLSRRSTTTTAVPPVEANSTSTTAVPLATSELIPVMVQDANKLLHVVYVRRDQIPPGGIPIAMSVPFPGEPTQQQQPQQQASSVTPPQLPVNSSVSTIETSESTTVPSVLPTPPAQS
uniref:Uncharacterized protein n=1 Tax=Anopheles melas TaxID=34690 RepID=A0A182TJR7_9DIPT